MRVRIRGGRNLVRKSVKDLTWLKIGAALLILAIIGLVSSIFFRKINRATKPAETKTPGGGGGVPDAKTTCLDVSKDTGFCALDVGPKYCSLPLTMPLFSNPQSRFIPLPEGEHRDAFFNWLNTITVRQGGTAFPESVKSELTTFAFPRDYFGDVTEEDIKTLAPIVRGAYPTGPIIIYIWKGNYASVNGVVTVGFVLKADELEPGDFNDVEPVNQLPDSTDQKGYTWISNDYMTSHPSMFSGALTC